jgi:hypothetical protein
MYTFLASTQNIALIYWSLGTRIDLKQLLYVAYEEFCIKVLKHSTNIIRFFLSECLPLNLTFSSNNLRMSPLILDTALHEYLLPGAFNP